MAKSPSSDGLNGEESSLSKRNLSQNPTPSGSTPPSSPNNGGKPTGKDGNRNSMSFEIDDLCLGIWKNHDIMRSQGRDGHCAGLRIVRIRDEKDEPRRYATGTFKVVIEYADNLHNRHPPGEVNKQGQDPLARPPHHPTNRHWGQAPTSSNSPSKERIEPPEPSLLSKAIRYPTLEDSERIKVRQELQTSMTAAWERTAKLQYSFWNKLWRMEAPKAVVSTTGKVVSKVKTTIERQFGDEGRNEDGK